MSDTVMVAVITGVPLTLTAIGTLVTALKLERVHKITVETKKEVSVIKEATNGINAALVQVTGEKEFLKGHAQGVVDAGACSALEAAAPEVKRSWLEKFTGKKEGS
jgi:hypothetical protein